MITVFIASTLSDVYGEVDVYFNEKKEFIGMVNASDGDWRHEYFDPIFKSVGVNIESVNFDSDNECKESLLRQFPDFFDNLYD